MGSPFVFLLNKAAAGAAAVTVLMAAVFWRRAVKRGWVDDIQASQPDGSDDDAQATSEADCPFPGTNHEVPAPNHEVPAIFLSHSGKQKSFVENLYNALQNANHEPFFDKHTLPKGSPFPAKIKQAALGCKLAVVVLSNDFLTSKWPMRELEMLVLERGAGAKVLPLFYKLSPQELKSPENLIKWQCKWKEIAARKWEEAVKGLYPCNGEVFTPGTSEDAYIKRVVRCICKLLPSPILYDLSQVQGHQRLAKEVAGHFEKARMVGLHGVGGLGKTTVCKIMVNFYNSKYPGRSHLIEFPSDGSDKKSDKKTIVQECKKALRKLANLSNEHLLNEADSFDQVVKLMRENLGRYDVFLAIDNIWESSLEEAKSILNVSFSANSKILFTSRSKITLVDLLPRTSVCPLPAPEHEEAFEIFQEAFELDDLNSLVTRNQLDSVLNTCFFNGNYHALALKSLGRRAKRVCAPDKGSENIGHSLSHILEEISCKDLPELKDVIRLNYDNLRQPKKHMFLDIAVLLMQDVYELTHAKAQQWLSFLYKEESSTSITSLIHDLAYDGLIELENIAGGAGKIIKVHDLYFDLAQREVKRSPRFFIDESVEKIEWERLERVFLHGRHHNPRFIEKLQQQECRKLQVLCATDEHFGSGIRLDLMPSLCALKLEGGTLRSIKNWSSLINLERLSIGRLNSKTLRVLNLNALVRLQQLSIKSSGVVRIEGLNALKSLQRVKVEKCKHLESLDGLSPALKYVRVRGCKALKKMPDVSGLTCLETLWVHENESMEEVGGENLSSTLKELTVFGCRSLRRFASLNECVHLHTLTASPRLINIGSGILKELANLHTLHLNGDCKCDPILKCLNVGCLPSDLKCLKVWGCEALEEIGDLSVLQSLETLEVNHCPSLKKLGGLLSILPHLQRLMLTECGSLGKCTIPDVSLLSSIPCVIIRSCGELDNYPRYFSDENPNACVIS